VHLVVYFHSCSTVVGPIALNVVMIGLLSFQEGGDGEKENDTQMLIEARRKTEWKSGSAALQV
jgi:hypothetical protein